MKYQIKLSPYANIFYTEWLLDSNSYRYNMPMVQTLYGVLDVEKLRLALKRYVAEHVLLNSHIQELHGESYWVSNEHIDELEYVEHDLSSSELFSYASKSFNLHHDCLYRFRLLRISDNVYKFIVVLHHLVLDGTSMDAGVFAAISNYYNDDQYTVKHSILEQIELITNLTNILSAKLEQNQDAHKEFWRQQLADTESVDLRFLKLNSTAVVAPVDNNPIAELRFSYGAKELDKLKQMKNQYMVTPYIYGQCIFALLLHRYTGQERFAINYPVAIREYTNYIYGAQLNNNIIPYQFHSAMTVVELLNQSREFFGLTKQAPLQYSYYPIAGIMQTGSKDLLNTSFVQTNLRDTAFKFYGITKVEISAELNIDATPPDMLLFEQEFRDGQLHYRIRYDQRTIDKELLNNFVASFKKLFAEILADLLNGDVSKLIIDYKFLSYKQYQQLIYDFNQTDKTYPQDKTIHQLFEEQVLKTPNNIAVVYEDTKLTYQELNSKANQLANYLRRNYEIKPDDLVVLCLDRSEQMIIAMLGILKSGAAYVPLSPNYPDGRIECVLNDIKTNIILTNELYASKMQRIKQQKVNMVVIDNKKTQIELADQKDTDLMVAITSSDLAYVIYTSGTSGGPRGAMIEHKGVASLVKNVDYVKVDTNDSFVQLSDPGFDAATFEIWASLLNGARLFIPSDNMDLFGDIELFQRMLIKNKVTVLWLTKTLFDHLFLSRESVFENIVYLLVGGEALNKSLMYKLVNLDCAPKNVINGYGPTENTTFSCVFNITKKSLVGADTVPIGAPLTNRQAYILDKNLNPMPVGAIGELYVGGMGLARGYVNNSDLTAEKFINNPFQTKLEKLQNKNSRLYKTGDLVRMLLDGNIEYIGRNDSQIKINGYRVELHEIENELLTYPEVKQAAVIVKALANNSISKHLLAYYVADKQLDEVQVQDYLAARLPQYMLPQQLIYLTKLPLLSNGKLDKRSLLESGLINSHDYIAPETQLQKQIIKLWSEILNVSQESVGITNSFFSLGGNSLLAIKLVKKLTKIKKCENIKIVDIFKHTTIRQLTNFIMHSENDNYSQGGIRTAATNKADINTDIAIIAMSGAFSSSENIDQYWDLIQTGAEGIRHYTLTECRELGVPEELLVNPNFVPTSGHVPNIDKFDAGFWGMSPSEAKATDPQIRKFLEHCWCVLEESGYSRGRDKANIGVFAGAGSNGHSCSQQNNEINHFCMKGLEYMNTKDILATKASYLLGLTGVALNINTACSTGLVTVIEACMHLASGCCDMAIAGGVQLSLLEEIGHIYQEGMIFSKDGYCRVFDDKATGTIGGSGVGVVLLKRLADAKKDNDNIIAVIKGYGTNNDGNRKMSYTSPSVNGQKECIISAQNMAKVTSELIDYIECHGTGTKLGDPVEIRALDEAFKSNIRQQDLQRKCVIGSVKANIGHCDVAAGIASLIKVCKMLEHKVIPRQINYDTANEALCLDHTNFEIATSREWQRTNNAPRLAGISAFGIGGTNAHIIVSEYMPETCSMLNKNQRNSFILPLSAKTSASLEAYKKIFITYLANTTDNLENIAYTMQLRREHFDYRLAIVCDSKSDAINKLAVIGPMLSSHIAICETENGYSLQNSITEENILSKLWVKGHKVDFNTYYHYEGHIKVVKLPSYCFDNTLYLNSHTQNTVIAASNLGQSAPLQVLDIIDIRSKVIEKDLNDKYYEIAREFLDALGVETISIYDDFFTLGGDSLLAIKVVANLQRNYKISVDNFVESPTIAKIAEIATLVNNNLRNRLEKIKAFYAKNITCCVGDINNLLKKQADYLYKSERILVSGQQKNIKNVLLTGVTGHVGCNILYQLLHETEYSVYLPVRATTSQAAFVRVNNKYKYYFNIGLDDYRDRIIVLPSDLEQPKLGLSSIQYQKLIAKVDSIIHSAAMVNYYHPYTQAYQANVQATINLLELAKLTVNKDFHYISTIGVLIQDGYIPEHRYFMFHEDDDISMITGRHHTYARTKYEGEVVVKAYRQDGVISNIYRLGNVAMHSTNYKHQENLKDNAFFRRLKALLNLKLMYNELLETEVSPVDYVATAIVRLFNKSELNNQTYHIFNPHLCNLHTIFTELNKQVDVYKIDEYLNKAIMNINNQVIDDQLMEVLMLHHNWLGDINNFTQIDILQNKTNNILAQLGFFWPKITKDMFFDIVDKASKNA